jgi:hypothetical protein
MFFRETYIIYIMNYRPDDGGSTHLWNLYTLARLHGAISQKATILKLSVPYCHLLFVR